MEQRIGRTGNGDRRPERYPARGIKERQVSSATHERTAAEKNRPEQEVLAFSVEGRSDAPKTTEKGTETLMAKRKSESLAGTEDGRSLRAGKQQAGITTSQEQQRESGSGRDDRRRTTGIPEVAWARNWGTTAKRNLSTAAGARGGNREAGRKRSAEVRHSVIWCWTNWIESWSGAVTTLCVMPTTATSTSTANERASE